MKIYSTNGKDYRLPNELNTFQLELYIHLIDWKQKYITKESGTARGYLYDAILPESYSKQEEWPHLYQGIQGALKNHRRKNDFRIHPHFYHMASSQAANINLFLPILHHSAANAILRTIRPDFETLATEYLDHGYCIEFWGGNFNLTGIGQSNNGLLGDKSKMAGTDSDIAIAYRNQHGELCLWLVEHKLTEKEFTECGGFKSKGRRARHDCSKSFAQLLETPQSCYYHDVRKYKYWEISKVYTAFFANHAAYSTCPFRGGMNQLWRNQLLALSIEQDAGQPYKHVHFSVVSHPDNHHLDGTLAAYKELIVDNPKFSVFTSEEVVSAAEQQHIATLDKWVAWYRGLYRL